MNSITLTIATANKRIGFRLTGNLIINPQSLTEAKVNPDQTYQIEIFPGEAPVGTMTYLRKGETKSIPIELPKELRMISYEKAFTLLLQNSLKLAVSEHGYEKIGNRKLVAEFASARHLSSVNVDLLIEGYEQGFDYRLTIYPGNLKAAHGEVKEKNATEYQEVSVSLGEMADIKEKIIKKVLLKLKPGNFQVLVDSKNMFVSLSPSLIQYISSAETPRPKPSQESIRPEKKEKQDAIDFEEAAIVLVDLPKDNQEAHHLLNKLEDLFADKKNPNEAYLKRLSRVINQFYASESFRILNKCFSTFNEHSLTNSDILNVINKTLSRFQLINLQREMKGAAGKTLRYASTFIETLEPAHYLKALTLITQSLRTIEPKEQNLFLIYQQLKILIGILNGLALKKGEDKGSHIYRETLELMGSLGNQHDVSKHLMVDYLLRYCQRAFTIVSGSQEGLEVLNDNALNLFKDFAEIDDMASVERPWTIPSKSFKNESEGKGVFSKIFSKFESWRTNDQQWFADLSAVHRMLLDPSPRMIMNFTTAIKTNVADVQNQIDLQNPCFVFGLAETLVEMTHLPEFDEMDEKIKSVAQELLEMILQNNENEDKSLPFHIHQKEQRQELIDALKFISSSLII